jgi:hypothetical protein
VALPFGTKVYLENKTLKKVEDLVFGDKVLSVKIEDSECTDHSSLYRKYLKKDSDSNNKYIEKQAISLSSTYVYSIFKQKHYANFIDLNNNIISAIWPFLVSKTFENPEKIYIKDSRDMVHRMNDSEDEKYFMQYLGAQSFGINSNSLNKNIFIDSDNVFLQKRIDCVELNVKPQPVVGVVLLDNHLLVTENFICFGSIVGGDSLL